MSVGVASAAGVLFLAVRRLSEWLVVCVGIGAVVYLLRAAPAVWRICRIAARTKDVIEEQWEKGAYLILRRRKGRSQWPWVRCASRPFSALCKWVREAYYHIPRFPWGRSLVYRCSARTSSCVDLSGAHDKKTRGKRTLASRGRHTDEAKRTTSCSSRCSADTRLSSSRMIYLGVSVRESIAWCDSDATLFFFSKDFFFFIYNKKHIARRYV